MRLLKKVALCAVLAAGSMALVPSQATAASFYIDLCAVNATECAGDNITEASLLFDEILGGDANDYNLTMTLTGTGTDTADQVSFTIGGVATPGGYESRPTVTGPAGTDPWSVFFDNVANSDSCEADGGSSEVCANQTNFALGGPPVNGTNVWNWFVDLDDDLAPISAITTANFRVHFLTAAGAPGGNLSPGGGLIQTNTTTPTSDTATPSSGTPSGAAPEPTVMTLLGAGLVLAGRRLRRRKA